MGIVYDKYIEKCNTPSDINEHLPVLYSYAAKSKTVTEFGVWKVCSTWALAAANPQRLVSYDAVRNIEVDEIERMCAESSINFKFIHKSDLEVEIEQTDFLFIDTFHTYDQLIQELNLHSSKVNKWIALHDTVTFGSHGEHGHRGLNAAVDEFLENNKNWKTLEVRVNNNGLTVLERIS